MMTKVQDTFSPAVDRLRAEEAAKVDVVLSTVRDVRMVPGGDRFTDLRFENEVPRLGEVGPVPIFDHAHGQIAGRTGIPLAFYWRLAGDHPDVLAHTVNTLWEREPKQHMIRAFVGNGDAPFGVRAVLSNRYRVVDNLPFLTSALEEAESQGAVVKSAHVDNTRLYVKLVTPRVKDIKEGDAVQAGAIIRNSEVGDGRIEVAPFVVFLACDNGMVSQTNYTRIHLGGILQEGIQSAETQMKESDAIFSSIKDWLRYSLSPDNLDEIIERIRDADANRIETPARLAVANIVRMGGLTHVESDGVLERFLRANNDTQRTMIDSVTHLARSSGLNYRHQVELEEFGGKLLEMEAQKFTAMVGQPLNDREIRDAFSQN